MKTTLKIFCFFTACLLALTTSSQTMNQDKDDNLLCLKASGKIFKNGKNKNNTCKVVLINAFTPVDSVLVIKNKTFSFNIAKDNYYTLKISKEGYKTKLISIWTPFTESAFDGEVYGFPFETTLEATKKESKSKLKVRELPIQITFSEINSAKNQKEEIVYYDITIPKY